MGLNDRDYYRPGGFGGFSLFPPVIKNLLIINAAVYFIQFLLESMMFNGIPGHYYLNRYFALNPIVGADILGASNNFQIWQLVTYQFLHGGFSHIFFNMLMLWMFGMEIENFWGGRKFLFFYLLSGIVGGILQLIISPFLGGSLLPTIGASGAVYGVMVAFAMFFPDRYIMFYFFIPVKAKYLITIFILFEFMAVGDMSFVAHLVHIGGAIAAAIFVLLDRRYNFNIDKLFSGLKPKNTFEQKDSFKFGNTFRKPFSAKDKSVVDADFYEINNPENKKEEVTQEQIDKILDKISQSGYQNLTDKEKRILFEASKKN